MLLIILIAIDLNLDAQLDLKKIMSGNTFVGPQPENIFWAPGNDYIFFTWNHNQEAVAPYYAYSIKEKKYRKLSAEESLSLPVDGYYSNESLSTVVYKKGDRLFDWNTKICSLIFTKFSPYRVHAVTTENKVILREGENFFVLDKTMTGLYQLTNFQKDNAPGNGTREDFLSKQQEELFEIVQLDKKREQDSRTFNEAHSFNEPDPFYLEGRYMSFINFNEQLTYAVFGLDTYPDDKYTHIESFVTSDGYSRTINARPKVGSEDPKHEVFLWDIKADTYAPVDFSFLSGVKKRPEFLREYEKELFKAESDQPKKLVFLDHGFNQAGTKALIEIKSYDNKDRWIVYYDFELNKCVEVEHQHDEKWIGGPGISGWKLEPGNVGWINNTSIYFQSEVSGYSHLYRFDLARESGVAGTLTQLTSGEFEIHSAILSKDKTRFFITANKLHPGNREFYILQLSDQKLIPVLTQEGNFEVHVSPDEKWLAVRYSYKNKPWELYLAPLKENTSMQQITNSTTEEFNSYSWRAPQVISFKANDGTSVYARLYEPEASKKNGAGIIFVHGAGYLQNAHNWWSSYHREFMFNNMLADMGYTVMDIDYRASEGYGRDFRTGIYRHMGGKDLSDQLDGRQVLIDQYGIDPKRVGIYGGSYGGFITLMALLTEPGKFKCGAALRFVTDWAHYNHEYTSNILNTPSEDPAAYKQSSPIYFAEGLQDRLLMLHGMEDDNVQFQDVVRLSQRFIELGKTKWDLIGYPIEPHGFVETTSWTDEYRRIRELFEEELK